MIAFYYRFDSGADPESTQSPEHINIAINLARLKDIYISVFEVAKMWTYSNSEYFDIAHVKPNTVIEGVI